MAYRAINLMLSILVAVLGFTIAVLILVVVTENIRTMGNLSACLDHASRAACEALAEETRN